MTEPATPDDMRRAVLDAIGPALEGWQVMLDVFEGIVSRTRAMGWTDEQARHICAPQIAQMLGAQQPQ